MFSILSSLRQTNDHFLSVLNRKVRSRVKYRRSLGVSLQSLLLGVVELFVLCYALPKLSFSLHEIE